VTINSAGIINESGGGTTVVEDWEGSSPLSDWSGDIGSFTVQQSTVYEGSTAVECTEAAKSSITKDGLTVAPEDTPVSGYFYNKSGTDETGILFGAQSAAGNDSLDCYEASVNSSEYVALFKKSSGGNTTLVYESVSNVTGGWTKLTVDWQSDGTISVTFTDKTGTTTTISATDTTYSSGRIGVVLNGTNYADYLYYGT